MENINEYIIKERESNTNKLKAVGLSKLIYLTVGALEVANAIYGLNPLLLMNALSFFVMSRIEKREEKN